MEKKHGCQRLASCTHTPITNPKGVIGSEEYAITDAHWFTFDIPVFMFQEHRIHEIKMQAAEDIITERSRLSEFNKELIDTLSVSDDNRMAINNVLLKHSELSGDDVLSKYFN